MERCRREFDGPGPTPRKRLMLAERGGEPHAVEGADQVHLDDAAEFFELRRTRLAERLHRSADAGASDEDADAAETVSGGLEGGAHVVGVRHVGGSEDGRALANGF